MNDISSKYDNLAKLGSGNFGTAYKASNKVVNRIEAIKIIQDVSKLGDKATIEASVQHKLKHKNVVEIFDAFIRNDKLYILMEFLEGGSVFTRLTNEGKLNIIDSIRIAIDSLHGLQYIHNNNFVHRDVKPSNILLDKNGMAKLSDFGLTAELNSDGKYDSSFGYRYHKAPEVYMEGQFRRESDIFALGLTLYRMVNGDGFMSQFANTTIPSNIIAGMFPPRTIYSPDVPKKLIEIINKALELNPDKRYSNAHSMRSDLSKINIPISWINVNNTMKKQIWLGNDNKFKYKLEVNRNIFTKTYDILVSKGRDKYRKVTKHCYLKINEKEMRKKLNKLLTQNI